MCKISGHLESRSCRRQYSHSTPLSRFVSWRPVPLFQVGFEEGCDEAWVKDEGAWNPGSLLQAISLPVYQLLEASTPVFHVQDTADGERWMIVNETGR